MTVRTRANLSSLDAYWCRGSASAASTAHDQPIRIGDDPRFIARARVAELQEGAAKTCPRIVKVQRSVSRRCVRGGSPNSHIVARKNQLVAARYQAVRRQVQ